jgi:hypothetical protein
MNIFQRLLCFFLNICPRSVITLNRFAKNEYGIFGVLIEDGIPLFTTLEHPDLYIPASDYVCDRHVSPSQGLVYKVLNVEGRTDILFHIGNNRQDTIGCILIGSSIDDFRRITNSKLAFNEFMERKAKFFDLHIIESYNS